jgi:outer membrane receptor for ferrienterochelin and colicins
VRRGRPRPLAQRRPRLSHKRTPRDEPALIASLQRTLLFLSLLSLLLAPPAAAQTPALDLLLVEVRAEGEPVAGASVRVGAERVLTDAAGVARFSLRAGEHSVTVEADGFVPAVAEAVLKAGVPLTVAVELEALEEEVVVFAARSATRIEDQPLRVEVIDREEIEEKALMTPGSVAMLLGETTGLRVQVTSPSMGASNVRIQGLRGHYSQLLADGLPLYGAQGDSFSLLQVPPLDLGQVEVIKGVASALYGTSAIGGVVNLVSRRPRESENEILLNATTLGGVDATGWVARPSTWSWSAIAGYHGQERKDVDGDGWTDVAGYDRGMIRPRVTFDNERGTSILFTAGFTDEGREGGTITGRNAPDGRPFEETLHTRHADLGSVAKWFAGATLVSVRGSLVRNDHNRVFGGVREQGRRETWFGEASATGSRGRHTWVAGASFQQDRYDARELPRFNFSFSSPAAFAQDEIRIGPRLTLAGSLRVDAHSEYGTLVSPRASLLARPTGEWVLRASVGGGSYAPTPFNEETDETGLARLAPLVGLRAESARGGVVDATFHRGRIEISGTLFASRVERAVQLRTTGPSSVTFENAAEPTRTHGSELIVRYRHQGLLAMVTHAWTKSTEFDPDARARRDVPLTPRHYGSLNLIWEKEGVGGVGLEAYGFGRQSLEDDPSLTTSNPYVVIGALARRRFGRLLVYVNAENLLDVRQTREESVVLPARRPDGRWMVDAWAPLDGRVLNAGVRVFF